VSEDVEGKAGRFRKTGNATNGGFKADDRTNLTVLNKLGESEAEEPIWERL
jgi:hypothetical protein